MRPLNAHPMQSSKLPKMTKWAEIIITVVDLSSKPRFHELIRVHDWILSSIKKSLGVLVRFDVLRVFMNISVTNLLDHCGTCLLS